MLTAAAAGGAMHIATTPEATRPQSRPRQKPRRSAVESKPIIAATQPEGPLRAPCTPWPPLPAAP